MFNRLKITDYIADIFKDIESGKIKNLIVSGEDIFEYFKEEYVKNILEKLDNLIVISPFEDGISMVADISIGSSLWMEEEGSFEGFFGVRNIKPALRPVMFEKDIVKTITEKVKFLPMAVREERKNMQYYDFEYFENKEIYIYDFSYFTYRSDNLMNWKMKKETKQIINK